MISVEHISKSFDTRRAIDDISFSIKSGEIVGLLGPNGAGKTTTMRLISGFFPPTSGEILIDGKKLSTNENLKENIGYLPENNPLYEDMTVEEFLLFFASLKNITKNNKKQSIARSVEQVGLQDVFYRPIGELSKGYRQRTGLAQAILNEPDVLILDEPTEGLDPNQRVEIRTLMKTLGKNRTVIISSHVLGEIASTCERIMIINKGKLIADGTPDALQRQATGAQRIVLVYKGASIEKQFASLKKHITFQEEKLQQNVYKLTGSTDTKKDVRAEIYAILKKTKAELLEFYPEKASLEDVFHELTTEQ